VHKTKPPINQPKEGVNSRPHHSFVSILRCRLILLIFILSFVSPLHSPLWGQAEVRKVDKAITEGVQPKYFL
jgi:hypothetical protein